MSNTICTFIFSIVLKMYFTYCFPNQDPIKLHTLHLSTSEYLTLFESQFAQLPASIYLDDLVLSPQFQGIPHELPARFKFSVPCCAFKTPMLKSIGD